MLISLPILEKHAQIIDNVWFSIENKLWRHLGRGRIWQQMINAFEADCQCRPSVRDNNDDSQIYLFMINGARRLSQTPCLVILRNLSTWDDLVAIEHRTWNGMFLKQSWKTHTYTATVWTRIKNSNKNWLSVNSLTFKLPRENNNVS